MRKLVSASIVVSALLTIHCGSDSNSDSAAGSGGTAGNGNSTGGSAGSVGPNNGGGGTGANCGNATVDQGETCEGDCPTSCATTNTCLQGVLSGTASMCTSKCTYTVVTTCIHGDGCCPAGCTHDTDTDCSATCGDGKVDPIESCDGDCPTSCAAPNACMTATMVGGASSCSADCVYQQTPGCKPANPQTYYLDAVNGNDSNDGSQQHPFQTFKKALGVVKSGDTVLMNSGDYGDLNAGRTFDKDTNYGDIPAPKSLFTDWVTFKAAPGQLPHANTIDLGTLNTEERTSNNLAVKMDFSVKGNADAFLRFEGLEVDDGVYIKGSRFVQIVDCKVHRKGPLSGSVTDIDNKTGINVSNGRFVTLLGNDVTGNSIGIAAYTYDFSVINNNIHDNAHDGIRIWGGKNWLIEGNWIHDLDDGADDNDNTVDPQNPAGQTWNRHTDGIHAFTLVDVTTHITIRRNFFFHLESMGIMWNDSEVEGRSYGDIALENNVFGPASGVLMHLGATITNRFVYRNNTVLYAPNDSWVSLYPTNLATGQPRTMAGQAYDFRWPNAGGTALVYNNIFADDSQAPGYTSSAASFTGHNTYRAKAQNGRALARGEFVYSASPYPEISGTLQAYLSTTGMPGALTPASEALNAGTLIGGDYQTPLPGPLHDDFNGTGRDVRPDLGAFETQGQSPQPEHYNVNPDPQSPMFFVDDFTDTRLDLRDPFLNTADTIGLAWLMPDGYAQFQTAEDEGNYHLTTIFNLDPSFILSTKTFANITFSFDFSNSMEDCGPVLLYQDTDNHYYVNIGAGTLVRKQGGSDTVVGNLTPPNGGRADIGIAIVGSAATFTMAVDGAQVLSQNDPSAPFASGAVGFYRNRTTGNSWDRINYDNVKIALVSPADAVGDLPSN